MHFFRTLIFCVVATSFLGCARQEDGTKKIFRYNQSEGIASLDPAFAKNQSVNWAVHQLYNTLVNVNDDLEIEPSLAVSWHLSNDRRTYTFYLRNDVYFHDNPAFANGEGRKMIASDIVYSLKRLTDPATASPGAWLFNDRLDTEEGFTAPNDSTFVLKLKQPFQPILGILSMQYCSVVPWEVVTQMGSRFRNNPCGTGPFTFKLWKEGQVLLLSKNERYFEKDSLGNSLPYLDGIKVSFLESKATEFLSFTQGKLDFINDIDPSFKDEILTKKGALRSGWEERAVLQKQTFLNSEYLGILQQPSVMHPLQNKLVRQAFNYAIDRHKMVLYLRNSIGTAAVSGFIPAGLPSFDSVKVKGYHYNVTKARQLLAEAGYENGAGLPVIHLIIIPAYAEMGSFIAKELEQIGVKVQVEVVQKSLLLEQTAKSTALFFRGSWIADYPDAENYLSMFYSKNPAPPNYTRYHNTAFDALYEKALQEPDDTTRYALYQQMDRMIIEDSPVIPLWYDKIIRLIKPNVKNFSTNSQNLLELKTTYINL